MRQVSIVAIVIKKKTGKQIASSISAAPSRRWIPGFVFRFGIRIISLLRILSSDENIGRHRDRAIGVLELFSPKEIDGPIVPKIWPKSSCRPWPFTRVLVISTLHALEYHEV